MFGSLTQKLGLLKVNKEETTSVDDGNESLLHYLKEANPTRAAKKVQDIIEVQEKLIQRLLDENRALKDQNEILRKENCDLHHQNREPKTYGSHSTMWQKFASPAAYALPTLPAQEVIPCWVKYNTIPSMKLVQDHTVQKISSFLNMSNYILKMEEGETVSVDKPVLIFCVKQSRLGVDVDSSLKDVKGKSDKVILVILHSMSHANQKLTPSYKILGTKDGDSCVKLMADVKFIGKGQPLEDSNNEESITKVVTFLKN